MLFWKSWIDAAQFGLETQSDGSTAPASALSRAVRSGAGCLAKWHHSQFASEAMRFAFERSSKNRTSDGTLVETGTLMLDGGAFVMAGKTGELRQLATSLPHHVGKIALTPPDLFQVGYARVGKEKALWRKGEEETVVIIAPQISWWDNRRQGEPAFSIHTDADWRPFVGGDKDIPVAPGRSLEMSTLASWLTKTDELKPWVWVNNNEYWNKICQVRRAGWSGPLASIAVEVR